MMCCKCTHVQVRLNKILSKKNSPIKWLLKLKDFFTIFPEFKTLYKPWKIKH